MKRNGVLHSPLLVWMFFVILTVSAGNANGQLKPFNNITLECSLKPFKENNREAIRRVAEGVFSQWHSVLKYADTVSVMLWTSDGSELLDYKGDLKQTIEWGRYIGNPNARYPVGAEPKSLSLHERAYLYRDNPPVFNYGDLKYIVKVLRETGHTLTGKPVRVGTTFDPGPEFAISDFKYKKHPEIVSGTAMGAKSFVVSYAVLNADTTRYAGFPKGIPANTPFGTFLGRQSQHFLTDMGFDYLWLSNGLGFGMEPWSSTGVIFTGKGFNTAKLADTREKTIRFWELFRKECPRFRVETRGTNLSAGIDLAKDGVDLEAIYGGNYNLLPAPNSPWAALDGDFGLELTGFMSRNSFRPDNRYLFRYYTHDPWWLNSPWLDRYGREPHDIYLPMSVAVMNKNGGVDLPTHLSFLSIDNSLGDMPDNVPNEVIPHVLHARLNSPDSAGPLVWVYPFQEYHQWARKDTARMPEMYFGDWFIRQAINNGLPLNTVISTANCVEVLQNKPGVFRQSVLVSVVPDAGTAYEKALMTFIQAGGKVLLYGPANHAGPAFRQLMNIKETTGMQGSLSLVCNTPVDSITAGTPMTIRHDVLFSGGGIRSQIADTTDPFTRWLARVYSGSQQRDVAWSRGQSQWNGGKLVYVRGTNSSYYNGGFLLTPDNPEQLFPAPVLMRYALQEFGMDIRFTKNNVAQKSPVLTVSRSRNAFMFSGYLFNTLVQHRLRLPQGAPVLTGYDVELKQGGALYAFPTAWNRECRFFVEQNEGLVSVKEMHSGEPGIARRLQLSGLKNATVRIYPESNITENELNVYLNAAYPWKQGKIKVARGNEKWGYHFVVTNVTGSLVASW